jgi:hypothetical protein
MDGALRNFSGPTLTIPILMTALYWADIVRAFHGMENTWERIVDTKGFENLGSGTLFI